MSEQAHNQPYKTLGLRLKTLREKLHLSLAEVCGAIEVDLEALTRIEQGKDCPAEDVLVLLLNHFNAQEEEATKLWELAGFNQEDPVPSRSSAEDIAALKPIVMLMQPDNRIMYTDTVNTTINSRGVVLNFLQEQSPSQHLSIARVGMSKDQAYRVIEVLQQALQADKKTPKALPAPQTENLIKDSVWLKRNNRPTEQ